MKIKSIGTGSSGNAYILTTSDGKHLLLDAGLPIQEIKIGLNFDIGNLEGCVISHKHNDHSKSASKLENMGIRVFRPYNIEQDILKTQIGSFAITSFPVPHNGTPNRAFIIKADGETVLYLTDAEYCEYKLKSENITAMLVECNYQADMIANSDHREHLCLGHTELSTCRDFVAQNATDALKTVILIHASESGCLNKGNAVKVVQEIVPKARVFMATKGLAVEL